jgi:hypothetical protein
MTIDHKKPIRPAKMWAVLMPGNGRAAPWIIPNSVKFYRGDAQNFAEMMEWEEFKKEGAKVVKVTVRVDDV